MKRYILFGVIAFVLAMIVMAPAGLINRVTDRMPGVNLLDTAGSIWNGQGHLLIQGQDYGQLNWQFRPSTLVFLTPTFDWYLSHPQGELRGTAGSSLRSGNLTIQGSVAAAVVNPSLAIYDIHIRGEFTFTDVLAELSHANRTVVDIGGHIDWSGGLVRYTLAGQLQEVELPALTARLQMTDTNTAQAVVYPVDQQTPLMIASMGENGFVKVGITKLFTKMLHNPWPGSDPDHAVVLEVEEQLL
ncbi:MAG: type II secretion system protein N [Gammaproteobacteria bacterium]|nr:type II secretion system protein N [Gammaproteobacteria bacterium]